MPEQVGTCDLCPTGVMVYERGNGADYYTCSKCGHFSFDTDEEEEPFSEEEWSPGGRLPIED